MHQDRYVAQLSGISTKLCFATKTADAALSVAVGGAAGCFLGTDISYGAANWMTPIGIQETYSPLLASTVAGT